MKDKKMDIASELSINTSLVRRMLVHFLRAEITKAGFERAVVGLSGGLDSSVACYLACEALGTDNVMALWMGHRTSDPESASDASEVANRLGVHLKEVEISSMVDALASQLSDLSSLRQGNIMARCRMTILYDQSAAFEGLVVGTSNKTELLLGYGTIFGDLASAVNPLGDLYKTQVRQLAQELGVPPQIIDKPPSADLWKGQTDEVELGFTYSEVDKLLYLLIDLRYEPDDVLPLGFAPQFVNRVMDLIRRNHFKRRPPVIAKLSRRTIGHDFHYRRDWGL